MKTNNYKCQSCKKLAVDWKGNTEKTCPKCEPNPDNKTMTTKNRDIQIKR